MTEAMFPTVDTAQPQTLVGDVEQFPVLADWRYLNHAAVSPLPWVVAEAMRGYADRCSQLGNDPATYRDADQVRPAAAALLGCDAEEIAVVPNTSAGLALVARGLDWSRGGAVVSTGVEFPANRHVWEDLETRPECGPVRCRWFEPHTTEHGGLIVEEDDLIEAMHELFAPGRTNLLAVSMVQFSTGQRLDIRRLAAVAHDLGGLVCIDGIQSVGAMPVLVRELGIDFVSADSHKWMLGPEGCGVFYCRRDLQPSLRPIIAGWLGLVDAMNFDEYCFEYRDDALRFEPGCPNIAGMFGMRAAIELLDGCSTEWIAERIGRLTNILREGGQSAGFGLASPSDPDRCGGIVLLDPPEQAGSAADVVGALRSRRIIGSPRRGLVRLSPHFYNTEAQMHEVVEALRAVAAG